MFRRSLLYNGTMFVSSSGPRGSTKDRSHGQLWPSGHGLTNDSLRSQLHCHVLERIMHTTPQFPLYAVPVSSVRSTEVGAVQVTLVTCPVPPATLVYLGTVVSARVIVAVLRAELVGVIAQRITCAIKYAMNIHNHRTA